MKIPHESFRIEGELQSMEPIGSGHINDTYRGLFLHKGRSSSYIFQRINTLIFREPDKVMENMVRVTRHLHRKLADHPDRNRRAMTIIPTRDDACYVRDKDNNCWRAFLDIRNASTHDVVTSRNQVFQSAYAYGTFQSMLVDLGQPPLHQTIPHFHDGPRRLKAFREATGRDNKQRAAEAVRDIEFVEAHAALFDHLEGMLQSGALPLRVTHNDTKLNNVLLDNKTGEGICVIDLDTVMPGTALFDFGDMVRSGATTGREDERDLSLIRFEPDAFEALLRGYLKGAGTFLNRVERQNLFFSGLFMNLLIGTRFLTDHLQGDTYFKIHRPNHNLDRARTHFAVFASMKDQEAEMLQLVERVCAGIPEPTRA